MINIRKSTLNDVDNNLLKIYIEGFSYHQNNRKDIFDNKKEEELKQELIEKINYSNLLVLEQENKIIGYILYEIKDKHYKKLWLDELVIEEKETKKGNAKLLIEKIKQIAKEENCSFIELKCWAFNKNALDFYEHLGFKPQQVVLEMKI